MIRGVLALPFVIAAFAVGAIGICFVWAAAVLAGVAEAISGD